MAGAVTGTAVIAVGGQSGQGSGLAAFELSQFGENGQQGEGGQGTDALDLLEPLGTGLQAGAGVDQALDFLGQLAQFVFQPAAMAPGLVQDPRVLMVVGAGLLALQRVLEFTPAGHEGAEVVLVRRGRRGGRRMLLVAELSQELGIDAIGFGQQTLGQSEVSHAPGVEDADREVSGPEGLEEGVLVAAAGFADDLKAWGQAAEPGDQTAQACGAVGYLADG
jgi:hypothetical protein